MEINHHSGGVKLLTSSVGDSVNMYSTHIGSLLEDFN